MNTKIPRVNLSFTHVELMITIIIGYILASLTIPSYKGYIYNYKKTEEYKELKKLINKKNNYRSMK